MPEPPRAGGVGERSRMIVRRVKTSGIEEVRERKRERELPGENCGENQMQEGRIRKKTRQILRI